jgi:hypothetical protein
MQTGQFYEGVKKEAQLFGEVVYSEDAKEGITAFWRNVSSSLKVNNRVYFNKYFFYPDFFQSLQLKRKL